jgi:NhaA family Na+:H+ antiporter
VIWAGIYVAGVQPTLAGVIAGFMTPVKPMYKSGGVELSPSERLQNILHRWVAFGIMPLFAFANAGVSIDSVHLTGGAQWIFWGVLLGLLVGKPIGILASSWLSVALKWASLPNGVGWRQISIIGMTGSIGFTMALFIAQLAFVSGPSLAAAKLSILVASASGGVLSVAAGHALLKQAAGG